MLHVAKTMKPAFLAAILLRLLSVALVLYTFSVSIAPFVATLALQSQSITSGGVLGELNPIYFIYTIIPLVIAVLLYIWSLPLGYIMTRDLE